MSRKRRAAAARKAVCSILALLGLTLGLGAGTQALAQSKRLSNGIFTEEQAQRGALAYMQQCGFCHGADLAGTYERPSLKERFISHWSGATLDVLFDYIAAAMPLNAPGSLKPEMNADILAFLLKQNGYPAGATPLPAVGTALSAVVVLPLTSVH